MFHPRRAWLFVLLSAFAFAAAMRLADALERARGSSADSMSKPTGKVQASELKPLLSDYHIAALNHAKAAENLSVDMLARLAIIKFFRIELSAQFAQLLERSRMMLKG